MDLKKVGRLIITALQKELMGQGHKASGNLVNSFDQRVMELPNSLVLEILMDDYGIYVNEGRKPGGKKVPINVLIDWVERKGIASGNKDVKNIAFAIQQTIQKEGSPTSGSFKFSNNGRRTGFIDFVIDHELNEIFDELEEQAFKDFDDSVTEIVKDFNKVNV